MTQISNFTALAKSIVETTAHTDWGWYRMVTVAPYGLLVEIRRLAPIQQSVQAAIVHAYKAIGAEDAQAEAQRNVDRLIDLHDTAVATLEEIT